MGKIKQEVATLSDYDSRIVKYDKEAKALKFDNSKPMVDLIPTSAIIEEARALTFGADRYGKDNWRGGMMWSRLIASTLRHIYAFNDGEDLDPESGLLHLGHARANLGFLTEYYTKGLGDDNRRK